MPELTVRCIGTSWSVRKQCVIERFESAEGVPVVQQIMQIIILCSVYELHDTATRRQHGLRELKCLVGRWLKINPSDGMVESIVLQET